MTIRQREALAFDRATSVRSYDKDGRLYVSICNISKSNVCGYAGSEIPDAQALGLDANKLYQLYRDPAELEKAAPTFNNLPVLNRHVPVSAADPHPEFVIGSSGTDAIFEAPYLKNSLVIWSGAAIQGVESGEQQEISSAYRYRAVMEPGVADGVRFDGRMVEIIGNHIAVIEIGRVGPDVIIGDAKPSLITKDSENMTKATLSRKAALAKGALSVYLTPKLAQDAKLDFGAILKGVTAKNFTAQKPEIFARIKTATVGKLAQDATLDDVNLLLDKLDNTDGSVDDDAVPGVVGDDEEDDIAEDAPDAEAIKAAFKDKLKPEEHAQLCKMLGCAPDVVGDEPPLKAGEPPITKQAMDAAISASVTAAQNATIARMNAVREAEQIVRPYIGELAIAQDSADAVYRLALDGLKIDHKDIKETAALKAIVLMQPKPGAAKIPTPRIAQDAAAASDYAKRFPHASRLVR